MEYNYVCAFCGDEFKTPKKGKKYCKQECYFASRHNPEVEITCVICGTIKSVPYRFRGTKTCSPECTKKSISRTLTTSVTKQCLACGSDYVVVTSAAEKTKYCSYECFLSTRDTRQPDVKKMCEGCGEQFTVPFTKRDQRFCGYSCANSGENNAMYGVTGSAHPMYGKKAWNNGLTTETDPRLQAIGEKVSVSLKEGFASGRLSNKGENNPNYGHTADTLTDEEREVYSKAAIKRVLDGVSGYKTGHLTGWYLTKKSTSSVKFKSSWELAAMMWWDASPDVVSYDYEPDVVRYAPGRRAIPDFFVRYSDGHSTYIEIKPTGIQEIPEVAERLGNVKSYLSSCNKSYVLMGSNDIKTIIASLGEEFTNAVKRYESGSTDLCDSVPER